MLIRRPVLLAAVACCALPVAGASAAQTTTLQYQCKFPLIGAKPVQLTYAIDLPDVPPLDATLTAKVDATARISGLSEGLGQRPASYEGVLRANHTLTRPDGTKIALPATLALPTQKVPTATNDAPAAPFDFSGSGTLAPFQTDGIGQYDLSLDRIGFNLTARMKDGSPTVLPPVTVDLDGNPVGDSDGDKNTFDVYCKLDPTTQNAEVATFATLALPTTPAPTPSPTTTPTPTPTPGGNTAEFSYSLQGSTSINTLTKGTMPLTGRIDATLDVATGNYTANTVINDTQGRLTALGFLPVTVTVGIVPSGPTTGKLDDDQLTADLKARIKVKSVKAFGAIPLAGGNNCQSKSLSAISLKSTDAFDPTSKGGTIGGSYAISDLNGCGPLNGLVSPLTAGGGNTITAKLTPILQ